MCPRELGQYENTSGRRMQISSQGADSLRGISLGGVTLSVYGCLVQGLPPGITDFHLQCDPGLIWCFLWGFLNGAISFVCAGTCVCGVAGVQGRHTGDGQ